MNNAELQAAIHCCNLHLTELTKAGDGDSKQGRLLRLHLRGLLKEQVARLPLDWAQQSRYAGDSQP